MIKTAKSLIDQAVIKIRSFQTGELKPIKTRFNHFNENAFGGLFPGMIVTVAGISGSGKTYFLQQLEEDLFNNDLNPESKDYALLRCNWEMTTMRLLLRRLKSGLSRSIRNILFNEVAERDIPHFKSLCDSERNPNIFYMEEPTDPETWYENVKQFLIDQRDKKHVLITIDHLALVRDIFGSKKKSMDELVERINLLKHEFDNVSFILISQLNREIENRTDIKNLAPKRSDLYNTDTLFHISDLVLVIHNPWRLGYRRYMAIMGIKDRDLDEVKYAYLVDHMDRPENNSTSFKTRGRLFYHYLKIREMEDMNKAKDIHIEVLNTYEENNFEIFR